MDKIWVSLSLVLLSTAVNAQNILVTDEFSVRNGESTEVIGEFREGVLVLNSFQNQYTIRAFNNNLRSSWERELEFDRNNTDVLGVNKNSDSTFTIYYHYREKGNTLLKVNRYDPSARLIDSTLVKNYGSLFFTPDFGVISSEDRSKILVYYVDNQSVIRALVFDDTNSELLWERSFEPEDFSEHQEVYHVELSNTGEVFVLIEQDNFSSNQKDHYYRVYGVLNKGTDVKWYDILMRENLTFDLRVRYDNRNRHLTAGGLYGEETTTRAMGYFSLYVDVNLGEHQLQFHEFTLDFLSDMEGKKVKKNKGVQEISIQELVLRQDGGVVILGEETKDLSRGVQSMVPRTAFYDQFPRAITDYYYNDMFALCVDPNGDLDWTTVLPKKQYSQDDGGVFSSYFMLRTPGSLRLVFNDEIKLENTVSEYLLYSDGNFDRTSILSTKNLKLRLRFRDATQVAPEVILVPSERRGRLRIARLEFQ